LFILFLPVFQHFILRSHAKVDVEPLGDSFFPLQARFVMRDPAPDVSFSAFAAASGAHLPSASSPQRQERCLAFRLHRVVKVDPDSPGPAWPVMDVTISCKLTMYSSNGVLVIDCGQFTLKGPPTESSGSLGEAIENHEVCIPVSELLSKGYLDEQFMLRVLVDITLVSCAFADETPGVC